MRCGMGSEPFEAEAVVLVSFLVFIRGAPSELLPSRLKPLISVLPFLYTVTAFDLATLEVPLPIVNKGSVSTQLFFELTEILSLY